MPDSGLRQFAQAPPTDSYPEPCGHCTYCRWNGTCTAQWEKDDHLSLVANLQHSQLVKLEDAGVKTVAALATLPPKTRIPDLNPQVFQRLRSQAALQDHKRRTGKDKAVVIDCEPGRGFYRLPKPDPGDLFFDMEGDPLHPEGLEYLFGLCFLQRRGSWPIRLSGRMTTEEERTTFGQFMDCLDKHLAAHPSAYIYHYNHYEPTALKRLAGSYAAPSTTGRPTATA